MREVRSYSSLRYVVISRWTSPLRIPTVPKEMPTGQLASAHSLVISSTRSGGASVARSRSLCERPRNASRTGPPTRASSCPWLAKSLPSSSATGEITESKAATARRCGAVKGVGSGTGIESRRWDDGREIGLRVTARLRRRSCPQPAPPVAIA